MLSNNQIKRYIGVDKCTSYSEEKLQETIQKSKTAFYENEAEETLSYAEFLYQQSKYIHKHWWILQGGILLILWFMLKLTKSSFYTQRYIGVAAPLFAIVLLPELWKNQSTNTLEIECAAYYSLRQIYAARIFLFALVDLFLLCLFFLATILDGKIRVEEMIIQFFLPYIVTCCICFRTLYSQKKCSETFALFLCIIWCAVWTQFVLNEKIYEAITLPIWFAMTVVSVFYLVYCIYKGQNDFREIWEEKSLWN